MSIIPKKSLGQNFLIDKNIQKKIISACKFSPEDIVLEIGSGRGELTALIAGFVEKIYSLEIDNNLYQLLRENLNNYLNIKLIHQDILKFDFDKYFKKEITGIKVIGNIPYYITTPIIEYLFRHREKISQIYLTVQKEFAQRIVARAGSKVYGALSCFVQYYTIPEIKFIIKRNSFYPAPKVDSCFIVLEPKKRPHPLVHDEELFFQLIRKSFNQRRKTLRNSLAGILPQEKLSSFFNKYGINSNIRPEDLTLEDFANLANA